MATPAPVCSTCHKLLIKRRTLPCLHSYCDECIAKLSNTNEKGQSGICCGICSHFTPEETIHLSEMEHILPELRVLLMLIKQNNVDAKREKSNYRLLVENTEENTTDVLKQIEKEKERKLDELRKKIERVERDSDALKEMVNSQSEKVLKESNAIEEDLDDMISSFERMLTWGNTLHELIHGPSSFLKLQQELITKMKTLAPKPDFPQLFTEKGQAQLAVFIATGYYDENCVGKIEMTDMPNTASISEDFGSFTSDEDLYLCSGVNVNFPYDHVEKPNGIENETNVNTKWQQNKNVNCDNTYLEIITGKTLPSTDNSTELILEDLELDFQHFSVSEKTCQIPNVPTTKPNSKTSTSETKTHQSKTSSKVKNNVFENAKEGDDSNAMPPIRPPDLESHRISANLTAMHNKTLSKVKESKLQDECLRFCFYNDLIWCPCRCEKRIDLYTMFTMHLVRSIPLENVECPKSIHPLGKSMLIAGSNGLFMKDVTDDSKPAVCVVPGFCWDVHASGQIIAVLQTERVQVQNTEPPITTHCFPVPQDENTILTDGQHIYVSFDSSNISVRMYGLKGEKLRAFPSLYENCELPVMKRCPYVCVVDESRGSVLFVDHKLDKLRVLDVKTGEVSFEKDMGMKNIRDVIVVKDFVYLLRLDCIYKLKIT